jgi:DNA (cytosine-5)-methyltransferase 1
MEAGELDPYPVYADLLRFPWQKYAGLVDIVSSGFPCQPFSHSGNRGSTEDERHLWPHIRTGISILRSPICFFENVDGIATAKSPGYHSVLHHVLGDLEAMGYRATAGQFSAQEVGATHLRKRWFILAMAYPNSDSCNQGKPRRASGQISKEGSELRRGQGEGEAGQESGCGSELAYSDSDGRREDQLFSQLRSEGTFQPPINSGGTDQEKTQQVTRWPARPFTQQHPWEQPRTVEPRLGRSNDGVPNRVDRLRALGNSVVPDVAAKAFTVLFKRLNGTDTYKIKGKESDE